MESCWCSSWEWSTNSTTEDSAFKVRLIPCIAYYLNKNCNSSVFLTTILLIFVYICLDMQSCWCSSWEWSTNSTTEDSALKVRLIPGIAYYLNKSHNSSVFSKSYFINFVNILFRYAVLLSCWCYSWNVAPTPQLWIQHLRWGSYLV